MESLAINQDLEVRIHQKVNPPLKVTQRNVR
jgi:hypothetical protein